MKGKLALAVDNEAAIKIAYNAGVTARNKHFKRVFHLVRQEITYQRLVIFHVGTKLQWADMFTFINNRRHLLRESGAGCDVVRRVYRIRLRAGRRGRGEPVVRHQDPNRLR